MKFQMSKNSLFAILLRAPWWISVAIAAALSLLAWVLLPQAYRVVGAFSSFPFVVIAAMAAWRQRHQPSAAKVEQAGQALASMSWPVFADLLEQSFKRDGFEVQRAAGSADFDLERKGRRMLVCAKRWKTARTGLEPLRALQTQRDASDAPDALYISLGELSDGAARFAAQHRIAIWQAAELAQTLRGLSPSGAKV